MDCTNNGMLYLTAISNGMLYLTAISNSNLAISGLYIFTARAAFKVMSNDFEGCGLGWILQLYI